MAAGSFADRLREARRLAILQLLAEAPGYETSAQVLYAALPGLGVAASADQVGTDLAWLAEQGLVSVTHIDTVRMARITPAGVDVTLARSHVPGVARPGP